MLKDIPVGLQVPSTRSSTEKLTTDLLGLLLRLKRTLSISNSVSVADSKPKEQLCRPLLFTLLILSAVVMAYLSPFSTLTLRPLMFKFAML